MGGRRASPTLRARQLFQMSKDCFKRGTFRHQQQISGLEGTNITTYQKGNRLDEA